MHVNPNLWGTISREGEVRLTSVFCILFVFSSSITYWKIKIGHFLPLDPPSGLKPYPNPHRNPYPNICSNLYPEPYPKPYPNPNPYLKPRPNPYPKINPEPYPKILIYPMRIFDRKDFICSWKQFEIYVWNWCVSPYPYQQMDCYHWRTCFVYKISTAWSAVCMCV